MKYKIGDKVKCDGGDWWFYATVSAVFEHSISPCYRLSVERMEKKSCKFSITQFEFELDPVHDVPDHVDLSKKLKRGPKKTGDKQQQIQPEVSLTDVSQNADMVLQIHPGAEEPKSETEKKQRRKKKAVLQKEDNPEKIEDIQKTKTSEAWYKNLEMYQKGQKSGSLYNWVSINRKLYQSGELTDEKLEKLNEINFPFVADRKKAEKVALTQQSTNEKPKRKRGEAWDINLESYRKGEKSSIINAWIALNRKEYKTGKLPETKLDKLLEINFPFESSRTKK